MNLPKKTFVGKKIPKQKFYNNIDLKASVKKKFIDIFESITFLNKFSSDTLGIIKSKEVEEIFIFDIKLKKDFYFDKIEPLLEIIDKSIPYPILFRFELDSRIIFKIASKRRSESNVNNSIVDFYMTKEFDSFEKEFSKIFNALNMKVLYENILKLFISVKVSENIEDTLEKEKRFKEINLEISKLEKLILKEKQADREYELHCKIKKLKEELE